MYENKDRCVSGHEDGCGGVQEKGEQPCPDVAASTEKTSPAAVV
jgi:hypothetical protein